MCDGRILVLLGPGEAPQASESLVDRIPETMLASQDLHFLVIQPVQDGLSPLSPARSAKGRTENLTRLVPTAPWGRGDCQKVAFRMAVAEGFAGVIVVPSEADLALEDIERFAATMKGASTDVVLGMPAHGATRSIDPGSSLWARAALRLAGRFERFLGGAPSGQRPTRMRGYATRWLANLPFDLNSADERFDTEMALEALSAGASIVELDVALGLSEAGCPSIVMRSLLADVVLLVRWRLHHLGLWRCLKFRDPLNSRYRDKSDAQYSSHALALDLVKRLGPSRVIDIGCGAGHVARQISRLGVEVTGIDMCEPERDAMHTFYRCDLERNALPVDPLAWDVVLLLDVLEHLEDPEGFVLKLRENTRRNAHELARCTLIISTPNVAFLGVRVMLLLGMFCYGDRGILDSTHKRLFTRGSLVAMLEECGYEVQQVLPAGVPLQKVLEGSLAAGLGRLLGWAAQMCGTMLAWQFIAVCKPRPTSRQMLEECAAERVAPSPPPHPAERTAG